MNGIICLLLPDAGQPYTDMIKKLSPSGKIFPLEESFAHHWQTFLFSHTDIIDMILEHTAANPVGLNTELAE